MRGIKLHVEINLKDNSDALPSDHVTRRTWMPCNIFRDFKRKYKTRERLIKDFNSSDVTWAIFMEHYSTHQSLSKISNTNLYRLTFKFWINDANNWSFKFQIEKITETEMFLKSEFVIVAKDTSARRFECPHYLALESIITLDQSV